MRYPGFVPTIYLRLPGVLSLTLFAHCYPSQTLLWLKIYQKLFSTHMHNWLLLYICRKNTYQSAVIRSISQCLAPKFASLSQPQKPEVRTLSEDCRCTCHHGFLSDIRLISDSSSPSSDTSAGQRFPPHNRTLGVGEFRVGGGVHDSYTFQCGLVGSFTSPGIDTR